MAMAVLDALSNLRSQSEAAATAKERAIGEQKNLQQEVDSLTQEEDRLVAQTEALKQRYETLLASPRTETDELESRLEKVQAAMVRGYIYILPPLRLAHSNTTLTSLTQQAATMHVSRERAQSFARDNSNAFRTAAQTFRNDLRSELDRQKNITAEVLKLREEEAHIDVRNDVLASQLAATNEKLEASEESRESKAAVLAQSEASLASVEERLAESEAAVAELAAVVQGFKESAEESNAFTKSYKAENVKLRCECGAT